MDGNQGQGPRAREGVQMEGGRVCKVGRPGKQTEQGMRARSGLQGSDAVGGE